MTEICDRVLKAGGPALLFEAPKGHSIPVLCNLFGTPRRVALAMGADAGEDPVAALREVGRLLAFLKEPEPPREPQGRLAEHAAGVHAGDADGAEGAFVGAMPGDRVGRRRGRPRATAGADLLAGRRLAADHLGPDGDARPAESETEPRHLPAAGALAQSRDHALAQHTGRGARFSRPRAAHPGTPFPVAVALGADPATMLGAVTPVPDTLSEYQFAGLLRGARTEIVKCLSHELHVPASAEIVLEGHIRPDAPTPSGFESAREGPFGDHTGYYNEVERFPVLTIERITMRRQPIYHSTYTGKPPDEPAILGVALNEVFVPLLQKQFPEIADFYLPPEGCSYRMAIVSMKKQYPGHAKRVMFGVWSFLRQFMYTKFVIVTDDDVDIRQWKEVVWAISTRGRSGARHADRREHADRLPRFRFAGRRARRQDGHRCDGQVAGRNVAPVGPADRDGRCGQAPGRRDLEGPGPLAGRARRGSPSTEGRGWSGGAGLAGRDIGVGYTARQLFCKLHDQRERVGVRRALMDYVYLG